jgi:hypothetical protein
MILYHVSSSPPPPGKNVKDICDKFEGQRFVSKKHENTTIYGNPGGLEWLRMCIKLDKRVEEHEEKSIARFEELKAQQRADAEIRKLRDDVRDHAEKIRKLRDDVRD